MPFQIKFFEGRVVSIDPAEKIIEGVVYYEVTIDFEGKLPEGIKPGMTADIEITSASKENILVIPEEAIKKEDGKNFVKVYKNGKIEKREIKVGLKGDGKVEVVSGLKEGEKIIL